MYLYISVAHSMNLTLISRSFPLSPYEKVNKRRRVFHSKCHFLPFGTVCMVSMGDSKRSALASTMAYPKHAISKAEIGVLLGVDPAFPGAYMFYIDSTRAIVPRNVVKPLNSSVIPFNWKPKVSLFSALQQFPVDLTVRQDSNHLIQPRLNPSMELPPSQYADQPLRVQSNVPQFVPFLNDTQQSVTQRASVEQILPVPTVLEAPVNRPAFSILPVVVPASPPVVILPSVTTAPVIVASVENVRVLPPSPVSSSVNISSTPAIHTPATVSQRRSSPRLVSPIVNLNSRPLSTRSTRGQPAPIFAYDTLGGTNSQGLVSTLSTNFTLQCRLSPKVLIFRHLSTAS